MKHTWKRVGRETLHDTRIFRLYADQFEHNGRPVHPYYVLEAPDWVNVVATTEADDVVLVRQYRHGADEGGSSPAHHDRAAGQSGGVSCLQSYFSGGILGDGRPSRDCPRK